MNPARRPLIAGNWKMNAGGGNGCDLAAEIAKVAGPHNEVDVVVAPPFTAIAAVTHELESLKSGVTVAAQNVHEETSGAYTGEVSTPMLQDAGARWVILGHSERRQIFGENDELVFKKLVAVNAAEMTAIVCVGETLEQREAGQTLEVVGEQVRAVIDELGAGGRRAVVAYEPIWAIGTGKVAKPEDAQEVHAAIRALLAEASPELAQQTRILYGGSVKANNAEGLLAQPDVDGALVGGASLDAEGFGKIIEVAAKLAKQDAPDSDEDGDDEAGASGSAADAGAADASASEVSAEADEGVPASTDSSSADSDDSDGPDSDGPDSDGPDSADGPDSDGPDSADGPDSDGPDSDGPDSDGPDSADGPDSEGPDSEGPDSADGPDSEGPDSEGPDSEGPDSADGPDSEGPDSEGSDSEGPDSADGPDSEGPDSEGPDSEGPDSADGPDSEGPDSEGPDSEGSDSEGPDSADGPDSDGPDSDGPDSDGPDSADSPDSEGPDSEGPDSDGPDSDGPDSDGPDSEDADSDGPDSDDDADAEAPVSNSAAG